MVTIEVHPLQLGLSRCTNMFEREGMPKIKATVLCNDLESASFKIIRLAK